MRTSAYRKSQSVVALAAATRSANTTVNGASVDCYQGATGREYRSVVFVALSGLVTDGTHTFAVQDSDDNSVWGTPGADVLQGTAPVFGATDDDVVKEIGYVGTKRYVRVTVTTTGATTGALIGAVAVLFQGNVDR